MTTINKLCWFLLLCLWAACENEKRSANIQPGIYVNHSESAYSIANDTIAIISEGSGENTYQVIRRTGFRRILAGKLLAPEYLLKRFTGIWDSQKQMMQLTENGIYLIFSPDARTLRIQNTEYRLLNHPNLPDQQQGRGL